MSSAYREMYLNSWLPASCGFWCTREVCRLMIVDRAHLWGWRIFSWSRSDFHPFESFIREFAKFKNTENGNRQSSAASVVISTLHTISDSASGNTFGKGIGNLLHGHDYTASFSFYDRDGSFNFGQRICFRICGLLNLKFFHFLKLCKQFSARSW